MKRYILFAMLCITIGVQAQQRNNVTSILEVLDIQTGERTVIKEFPYLIEAPNWTVDGKWIIYNSGGLIYKLPADGKGEPGLINTQYVTGSTPSPNNSTSLIYTLPLEGGTPKLITPCGPSYLHGWSPDGKTLAYCAFRSVAEGADIYTISVDGGVETRLTTAEGLDDGPEYSPDGKHIWFNSVRTGLMQVWRMNVDGSNQTQMTFDETRNAWFPHVSPDGKQVIYITYFKGDLEPGQHLANKNVELWLIPAFGGEPRRVAELFGGQGTINTNSWAPDSRHVAFISYRLND